MTITESTKIMLRGGVRWTANRTCNGQPVWRYRRYELSVDEAGLWCIYEYIAGDRAHIHTEHQLASVLREMRLYLDEDAKPGVVPRDDDGFQFAVAHGIAYRLTECCGASAKGSSGCVCCRSCYRELMPEEDFAPVVDGKPVAS